MALKPDGDKEVITVVLTKEQVARLKALAAFNSTKHRRMYVSDVAREVVEQGLDAISRAPLSTFVASMDAEGRAA